MKNRFKKILGKNNSTSKDVNPYNLYDEPDTNEIQEPELETIERDISSKRAQILTPKTFPDVKLIADELKESKVVLIDLSQLEKNDKRRVIDFISGVIYINDGSQKKLEKEIFKLIIRK